MQTQIYHKKKELLEAEFYKDKECTEAFDFTNARNLYIELKDGDVTPLLYLPFQENVNYFIVLGIPHYNNQISNYLQAIKGLYKANLYLFDCKFAGFSLDLKNDITTITPNLSKYIPEDNAVLFLSEESFFNYEKCFKGLDLVASLEKLNTGIVSYKKITIFLPNGTQAELQKANEVAKELMEKYGVEEVNLCALHWLFEKLWIQKGGFGDIKIFYDPPYCGCRRYFKYFNKIITTNSTGILKPEDSNERLQVIDCKKIFQEYLKENNF